MPPLILDCDPGHDDAVAILYAARRTRLLGITTVFGNQSVERTTRNALSILTLAGLELPVAMGADGPLVGARIDGGDVHGASGLDGAELPTPTAAPDRRSAVEFMIEAAHAHQGELVLCATGAMTNFALALEAEPRLATWLAGISAMGGTIQVGNTTPVAEFNIYADPEAADRVLQSDVPLKLVGLNVTRQVGVDEAEIAALRQGGRVARAIGDLLAFFRESLRRVHGLSTASLHDPCALLPLTRPEIIDYRDLPVSIELQGALTRGMTVVDFRTVDPTKVGSIRPSVATRAEIALTVDAAAAKAEILSALHEYG
jgi:inosine-uridine nucleoside N-ribohydrolase